MSSTLPPLPRIDGDVDLMLAVYTHKSLNFAPPSNSTWGDTDRLAELGAKVVDLTVTFHFFSQHPELNADAIRMKREETISASNLDGWLKQYGLKEKLRVAPSDIDILNDPEEITRYFNTYVGASYFRHGLQTTQTWISGLLDPTASVELPNSPPNVVHQPEHFNQPTGYPQQHFNSPQMHGHYSGPLTPHQSPPSMTQSPPMNPSPAMGLFAPAQPSAPPPPLPSNPPTMSPSSPMSSLVTLALVNQTAAQRGFQVSYPAEQVGPPHQPTWTVKCCMNGIERGRGVGKSQKVAKEEAARGAWAAMGWGPT